MNDKLTPCPFCAAPGYWDSIEDKSLWWCGCRECDVATKPFDTLAEAVAAWNRRATPTPPVEPVKEADVSAIRDAALEEAAKVCDDYAKSLDNEWNRKLGYTGHEDCAECADAIRALRGRTA